MPKPSKGPIPSPLNRVLETGSIGGRSSISPKTQQSIIPEVQQSVNMEIMNNNTTEHNGEMKKQTILISKSLAQRVKLFATRHDTSISDIATQALEAYLNQHTEGQTSKTT